jgi:predicted AlkP superfamily pyrophosphatase or phosphodiesterase
VVSVVGKDRIALALVLAAAGCAGSKTGNPPPARPPGAVEHVILVTVDGMMPSTYVDADAHGLRVPTLRRMVAEGASSDGATSVFPTVTYPAHTSIATGMNPGRHGIVTNLAPDPLGKNQDGWRWYSEDIRVPTLWDAAHKAGLQTVLVDWPVTIGAKATVNVPEYWRASTREDQKLARTLATAGVFDEVTARFPGFWDRYTPPDVSDQAGTDVAVHLIETCKPNLLMLHIWQTDDAQHGHGLWTPETLAAFENADAQIARLIEAAKTAGIWDRTILVVTSDHGFAPIAWRLKPNVVLAGAGLITLDPKDPRGTVIDWKATALSAGGQAYIYLRDANDTATAAAVRTLFTNLSGKQGSGVGRVYEHAAIAEIGGDPDAFLALEAADGWSFGGGYTGDATLQLPPNQGTHGYDPRRPEMRASLLMYGPPVAHAKIEGARLIDIAPTIAGWLRLDLPNTDGKVLTVPLAK